MTSSRLAVLALAACASGCATIIAGGPDEVPITTYPAGAYVYLDGKEVGRTPLVVTLDRKTTIGDIRIYYPGFVPVQLHRGKSFNGWTVGNFFIGMIPAVVDFATGNWLRFDDEEILVRLIAGDAPPPYGIQPRPPTPPIRPMQPQRPQEPRPPGPIH